MKPRILLLHNDPAEANRLGEVLDRAGYETDIHAGAHLPTHQLFHQPPSLLIVAEGARG